MVSTRQLAVQLGRQWMWGHNLFEHVPRKQDFEDEIAFYRFVKKRDRFASLNNNSAAFALSAYDLGIYLEDGSMASSSQDSNSVVNGNASASTTASSAPFYMSFANKAASTSAQFALQGDDELVENSITHSSLDSSRDESDSQRSNKRIHSLTEVAEALELNISVGRHRWRLKTYENCFVAKDAITYLVTAGFTRDRKAAVLLGKRVQRELNLYHHVCGDHDFADEYYFFSFTPKDQRYDELVMVQLPLSHIAEQFEHGVRLKSHSYRMKQYPNTFKGGSAVDFLVPSRLADSRKAAVRIGKALVDRYGLFTNLTGDVEFADDQFLFQFLPKEQRKGRASETPAFTLDGSIQTMKFNQHVDDKGDGPLVPGKPQFIFAPEALAKQRLSEIAEAFYSGVKVKSNRYRGRVYPGTFIGSEAVTFLVNSSCASSRKEAVLVGRRLQQEQKLFRHVKNDHLFKDDYLFYVFCDEHSDSYSSRSFSSDLSACTAQSLLPMDTIAAMVQKGVKVKDRRYHLKTYKGW